MSTQTFFATHPLFTVHEFDLFLSDAGRPVEFNRKRLLAYHHKQGRLVLIRPGLYGVVPMGYDEATFPVDTYLIAAYLKPDALIGYHTALAFHGVAHTLREERLIITRHPMAKEFQFQGVVYRTVQPPEALISNGQEDLGVEAQERQNLVVRVTGLERTLVDCLDRLRLSGGWEEVWRSYEGVAYLDVDLVVRYALLLDNATTIASVGYFLQGQQERWMVPEETLADLRAHRPRQAHYLGRRRQESGRLIKEWNLVVPERIIHRSWEDTDAVVT